MHRSWKEKLKLRAKKRKWTSAIVEAIAECGECDEELIRIVDDEAEEGNASLWAGVGVPAPAARLQLTSE